MASRPGARVPTPPAALPSVALAADHVPQHVAARVRRGEWQRVARGAYISAPADDRRRTGLARIVGVHHQLRAAHVFSHDTAALLWGLPLWSSSSVVHVYQAHRPGVGRDPRVRRHLAALAPEEATIVAGLPATSLELTIVDCARTLGPLGGLVVADAGLSAGASRDEMLDALRRHAGGRGTARARAVLELADPGAESAQESAVRFVLLRAGLPLPETQILVETHMGTFWADLGWPQWRLLIEYDGRIKYTDSDALVREKRRHDAIVEAGWFVIRVTREDLRAPARLVERVRTHLGPEIPPVRRPHLRSS